MFDKISAFVSSGTNQKQSDSRGLRPVRTKWDQISAYCQKFWNASHFIRTCNSAGTTDDTELSMTIAKLMSKRNAMEFHASDVPHKSWSNHLTYEEMRLMQKCK